MRRELLNINLSFFGKGDDAQETEKKLISVEKANEDENTDIKASDEDAASDTKKYSDEEVDRIISKKYAGWKAESEKEIAQITALCTEYKSENEVLNEKLRIAEESALEAAELKKELLAFKKGFAPEIVDFAVFQADKMKSENLGFNEALDLLLVERPELFLRRTGSTGMRIAKEPLGENGLSLKKEVYEKMGLR